MKFGKIVWNNFRFDDIGNDDRIGRLRRGGKDDSSVDSSSSAEQPLDKVTATKVVTYDGPSILESSDKVDISVEGKDLFVYESRVNHKRMERLGGAHDHGARRRFRFRGKGKSGGDR